MGTFGGYLNWYADKNDMPRVEPGADALNEEARAAGHTERTAAVLADHDKRKLLLSIHPPDSYNYAMYLNQAAASASQEVNYVFASQLRIFRDTTTGRLKLTDESVASYEVDESVASYEVDESVAS